MLYVIAGNGTGPVAAINSALKDLQTQATQDDVDFWFLLEGKDDPTKTDEAILKWLRGNEIWFEVVTATGTTYDGAQQTEAADDVFAAMVERLQGLDGETGAILALPLDPDGGTEGDENLMELVEGAVDTEIPVFLLNAEMIQVSLTEEETQAAPEPAPAKKAAAKKATAPAKAVAKKAAGVAKKAAPAEEEETVPEEPEAEGVPFTRDELAKMGVPELASVARSQGIDTKGLGKRDLITAIMTKSGTEEEAAVLTATPLNGDEVMVVIVPLSKVRSLLGG